MVLRHRWTRGEPDLQELLNDDVVRVVMQRDGVSLRQLDDLIHRVRQGLQDRSPARSELPVPANDPGRVQPM